jgi:hypothetical protein
MGNRREDVGQKSKEDIYREALEKIRDYVPGPFEDDTDVKLDMKWLAAEALKSKARLIPGFFYYGMSRTPIRVPFGIMIHVGPAV